MSTVSEFAIYLCLTRQKYLKNVLQSTTTTTTTTTTMTVNTVGLIQFKTSFSFDTLFVILISATEFFFYTNFAFALVLSHSSHPLVFIWICEVGPILSVHLNTVIKTGANNAMICFDTSRLTAHLLTVEIHAWQIACLQSLNAWYHYDSLNENQTIAI